MTTAKVGSDIPGDYSPDDRQLAFFREREDTQGVGSVWVVNVDGTGVKRLTPPEFSAGWGGVRWSPDGSKILLQSASTGGRRRPVDRCAGRIELQAAVRRLRRPLRDHTCMVADRGSDHVRARSDR